MLLACIVKSVADVEQARGLPVDYLELKGDMLCVDTAALRTIGTALERTGLPSTAMTSPLPRRFQCRIVGDDADPSRALSVFRDMCDRAAPFGIRTVVLGSGQARSVPPGFPRDRAVGQLQSFLTDAANECEVRGMGLALEPLAGVETNLVNSCSEARPLVDLLPESVGIAVDCYHIVSEGLSVTEEVKASAGAIGHAHSSSIPRGSMDFRVDVQAEFVSSLQAAGYTGGLTVEDEFTDFAREAPVAVGVFRQLLASQA